MAIVSSETLILFIATVLVAGSVAGALTGGVNRLSEAIDDRSIDVSQEIRTDVAIISDPASGAVYNNTTKTVTLLVKNTGSNTLSADPDSIDVIIDGVYRSNVTTTILDETEWTTGTVINVTVTDVDLELGTDHRARIHVRGNTEQFVFRTSNS